MDKLMNIHGFENKYLTIDIDENKRDSVNIVFSGEISFLYPAEILEPYFKRLHEELVSSGIREIYVDFKKLTYMNSSGFKTIIQWLKINEGNLENNRYIANIIYDPDVQWQESCLTFVDELFPATARKA